MKLRIFLSHTLNLQCDEFNIEATAGIQTANRIETMLSVRVFARNISFPAAFSTTRIKLQTQRVSVDARHSRGRYPALASQP